MGYRFLIVGSGFSGSVLARELVSKIDCHVEIWEERNHLAGNCYTSEDDETGIMIHHYGPHIFNTDDINIWEYFNKYSKLRSYIHRVKAMHQGRLYTLPVNLDTLSQFFGKKLSPNDAKLLLDNIRNKSIIHPKNFEEQALHLLGEDLYYAFFYGYTKKQWGCEPRELPASILKRLPIRFDHNHNYHLHQYTGIPEKGYTDFFNNILDHTDISVCLNKKFFWSESLASLFDHIFFTGSIDSFFNYREGILSYRTLTFEREVRNGDFQDCPQVNYCDEDIPFTRITEPKHFTPWKKFDKTIIFKEYSREAVKGDILYYPKRLKKDKEILNRYIILAHEIQKVSFLGRLGTYRYLDMQHVIKEAIDFSSQFTESLLENRKSPAFPSPLTLQKN